MSTVVDCRDLPAAIEADHEVVPFLRAIAARLAALAAWRERRRTVRALDSLDDWLLRDIGLERSELRRMPMNADPADRRASGASAA